MTNLLRKMLRARKRDEPSYLITWSDDGIPVSLPEASANKLVDDALKLAAMMEGHDQEAQQRVITKLITDPDCLVAVGVYSEKHHDPEKKIWNYKFHLIKGRQLVIDFAAKGISSQIQAIPCGSLGDAEYMEKHLGDGQKDKIIDLDETGDPDPHSPWSK